MGDGVKDGMNMDIVRWCESWQHYCEEDEDEDELRFLVRVISKTSNDWSIRWSMRMDELFCDNTKLFWRVTVTGSTGKGWVLSSGGD